MKFVFPNHLFARTKNNKTIDVSYAPQDMTAVDYINKDVLIEWLEEMKITYTEPEISEIYENVIGYIDSM